MLKGIGASDGIAIGKVLVYEPTDVVIENKPTKDKEKELLTFDNALDKSIQSIEQLRYQTEKNVNKETAAIFTAHIEILKDPELIGSIKSMITDESMNAAYATKTISDQFVSMFKNMDNEYLRERAADIEDVSTRLIRSIMNVETISLSDITDEVIIVSKDLSPSDTAQMNKEKVLGFITDIGGRTSHSAIMARTLEIPAVLGTTSSTKNLLNGDYVILDGVTGEVFINPDKSLIDDYLSKKNELLIEKLRRENLVDCKTLTSDSFHVELAANIGSPKDVEGVLANGAEGIGLYRTEFLYMDQTDFPSEKEQFEAYKKVLSSMKDKPVVIRTLDIGGDKSLDYMTMPKEMNPFLGVRAIRLCLKKTGLFRTQLRALLRASEYGDLHIMFPMIASINELLEVKSILKSVEEELKSEDIQIRSYKIGIMIEIPAAALAAEHLAKEVDFFSIGTNDLIQYTFAADRMNEEVSYLYQPLNPSLLKLISMVSKAANDNGIWVGMCGEMASDERAVPILIGLGLKELSMSATSILKVRDLVSKFSITSARDLAEKVLPLSTEEEVVKTVNEFLEGVQHG